MLNQLKSQFLTAGFLAGLLCCGAQSVFAQGNSLFSGSGLSKSGTGGISGALGASGFGGMTTGKTGSAGGGMGALGGGANPFGQGGQGGTGFGGSGSGGAGGIGGPGATGNSQFAGRTNTGFAGNSQAGQTGNTSGAAPRNFNLGSNASQRNSNTPPPEKRTSAIRPRQRVAFDFNARTAETIATKVSTRLDRIGLKYPSLKDVDVHAEGSQVVLTGKVKNAEQSRLAEILLRLEPGVRSVKNELEIEEVTVIE